MGSVNFQIKGFGQNAEEAYKQLVDQHIEEFGSDSYNGTISTTMGFTDYTKDFKNSGKKLDKYMEEMYGSMEKRECIAICVREPKENKQKIKSKVEHIVEKGKKNWLLRYVAYDTNSIEIIGSFEKKGDAVKAAREYTEKTKKRTFVEMERVLENGNGIVAHIHYKPSRAERSGAWIFFGWAAE